MLIIGIINYMVNGETPTHFYIMATVVELFLLEIVMFLITIMKIRETIKMRIAVHNARKALKANLEYKKARERNINRTCNKTMNSRQESNWRSGRY